MRKEARQIALTANDLVNILKYVVTPEGMKNLNRGKYELGDKINEWLAKRFSNKRIAYEYRGYMNPNAQLFKTILQDPSYLVITNFAVDRMGYFETCTDPIGYPEMWKVSLFRRKYVNASSDLVT